MTNQRHPNTETEDTGGVESMLEQAGKRFARHPAAVPPRAVLQSAMQSARVTRTDVTNLGESRYSFRRIIGGHMRIFVSATVAVVLLLALGGGTYYLDSVHTNAPKPGYDSQGRSLSPTSSSVPTTVSQQSDQDIDQSISQIDSQLNGLSADNQNMDQSAPQ